MSQNSISVVISWTRVIALHEDDIMANEIVDLDKTEMDLVSGGIPLLIAIGYLGYYASRRPC